MFFCFAFLLCRFSVSFDPCEVLNDFFLTVFGREGLITVAVAGAVEALAHEVEDAGFALNLVLHLQATEIVAIHDDEFFAVTSMLGHDVVTVASLLMCLVGHFDCLAESEAGF